MPARAIKLLLIEDDPLDAEAVRRNLARRSAAEPVELEWVEELAAGLDRLADGPFDLVLLDLGLPDSSGLETLEALRARDGTIPVLVLTGAGHVEQAVTERGAQAFLDKDALRRDAPLLSFVRHAIARQHLAREKLASLGVLSAGVAMGFNRFLGSILESAEAALAELEDARGLLGVRTRLHEIQREVLRAGTLAGQLRDYAVRSSLTGHRIDLSSVVTASTELIDALTPEGVEVVYDVAPDAAAARATGLQLHQLLLALVMNSVEALEGDSGRITVSTAVRDADLPTLRAGEGNDQAPPGRYASLAVADTGCGMDAATRARAFEPFFTTKAAGRGLGLAAALGIARQCGAVIRVQSAPGQGSRFEALFPHAGAAPGDGAPKRH